MAKKKPAKKVARKVTKKATAKTTQKAAKKVAKKKTAQKASTPARKAKVAPSYKGPRVGEKVPGFQLPGVEGRNLDLLAAPGKTIVLYFYPKDATPGCTIEGQDFGRLYSQFQAAGVEVFGVSRDSLDSHLRFCTKMKFPFSLLSDADEKACKVFDVIKDKNMYGKKVRGIERSTFVIGRDGILRGEWRKVSVEGHAQAVLDFIKTM